MVIRPLPAVPCTTGSSRAMIVGLALVPVVLVILASIPAMAVMPFTRNGWSRMAAHLSQLMTWTVAILVQSRT